LKLAVIAVLPPEGAPDSGHALGLCEALAARGVEVQVLTGRGSLALDGPNLKSFPVMRDWTWQDLPRLIAFLRRARPDALLLHYVGWLYGEHPLVTLAPGLARVLRRKVRAVTCLTSPAGASLWSWLRPAGRARRSAPPAGGPGPADRPEAVPSGGRALVRMVRALTLGRLDARFGTILGSSDRIAVLSEAQRAAVAEYAPRAAGRMLVIPPPPAIRMVPPLDPAERAQVRAGLGAGPEDFLFLYFGFIYPGKGVETLLRAFQLVAGRRPRARLALAGGEHPTAGPGYPRAMRELCGELGIAGRVAWTGGFAWDSAAPSGWLRAADAGVLPFDAGVQLNNSSFAAAAAHGLAVISTRGAQPEAAFADGENLRLCPPGDPRALAAAMEELADDAGLRARLGRGALELAGRLFSWEAAAERFRAALAGE